MTEHIKVEEHAVGFILRLSGQFIGGDETDALREEFKRLTQNETTNAVRPVIADMTGVTYLNSTALGVFISAHSHFSKRGGKIAICGMSKSIENIFVITKLTMVFEIFPSVDEAIHHFSS